MEKEAKNRKGIIMDGGILDLLVNIAAMASIYTIIVISLNMEAGYTGIPNFGKMLGVATGAFTVSAVSGRLGVYLYNKTHPDSPIIVHNFIRESSFIITKLNQWLASDPLQGALIFVISLLMAMIIGGLVGYIASYPAIRLREDYLAITLLAMAEAARVIGFNYPPIAGGTLGLQVPDPLYKYGENRFLYMTLILVAVATGVFLVYHKLLSSPLSRTLRAIRDNEEAALALGKNVVGYRMKVLVLGTATAALAGGLYAFYTTGVIATAYNRVSWTFWPWVMVLLGGMANNAGAVIGAFVFVTLRVSIIYYKQYLAGVIPFNVVWLDYLLLSITLLLVLMLRPQGILPEKPVIIKKPETNMKK
jgi:branched-chain amino acid transport system permease protein